MSFYLKGLEKGYYFVVINLLFALSGKFYMETLFNDNMSLPRKLYSIGF